MTQQAELTVSIWRGQGTTGGYQTFRVPRHDSQTVLDVVSWIQHYGDPTLSYRFACRVGMCGSCAMTVNGVPRWTCRTHVSRVVQGDALQVGPLRNLAVIKDLTTDMDPFFDKWTGAQGRHHPTKTRDDDIEAIAPDEPDRVVASAAIECINCAVCYAACDTVAGNPDYLGPAALQRAWTVVNDRKDGGGDDVFAAVSGSGGCFNCHTMGSCTQYCPVGLDPMQAIAGLKRDALRARLRRRRDA